jgi:hypothetical protein
MLSLIKFLIPGKPNMAKRPERGKYSKITLKRNIGGKGRKGEIWP